MVEFATRTMTLRAELAEDAMAIRAVLLVLAGTAKYAGLRRMAKRADTSCPAPAGKPVGTGF